MTCQAVPLQSHSMLSNHPDHDPPSRPDATPVLSHSPPPPTRTHHEPPPRSWSTARAQCQRDTGSATSTTISPHDSESATLDPTLQVASIALLSILGEGSLTCGTLCERLKSLMLRT
ncbi:unnamed protein product [Pleuronectes platessa]|uniref:Uncharacterized protein n=1 Tax=Pleuronectes platessa TaxID=8262 RepID=A0A9N7UQR7_PLEPL|nr:unnamed protein product [Pleuronectes platessa]